MAVLALARDRAIDQAVGIASRGRLMTAIAGDFFVGAFESKGGVPVVVEL